VTDFIPGQDNAPAAVVDLDEPIVVENLKGSTLILELRYVGAAWTSNGIVHVELCDFVPGSKAWQVRRKGKWIESHATYEKLA
jgi:hypothetical protein